MHRDWTAWSLVSKLFPRRVGGLKPPRNKRKPERLDCFKKKKTRNKGEPYRGLRNGRDVM